MSSGIRSILALAVTVILFSLVVIVARAFVADVSPMLLLFIRMVTALIGFSPFLIKSKVFRKKNFSKLVGVSLLSTVNVVFFIWGIQYTSASASQLVYAVQPALTILVSFLFLHEKYPFRSFLGVVIGLLGVVYIVYQSAVEKGTTISGGLVGNLAIVVAMLGWFGYILLSKKISRYFSPLEISSVSVLVSLFVSIILLAYQTVVSHIVFRLNLTALLAGSYMGFFGTFLNYLLLQYAIRNLKPLTVNLTAYIQPITVAFLAILLLGEKMTVQFLLGSILVFAGVFLSVTIELYQRNK